MKSELIVHIGMGKTGTSSIQQSLELSASILDQNNIKFLGYDLQHCAKKSTVKDAFKTNKPSVEYLAELTQNITKELEGGYAKVIISNERLFNKKVYISLFQEIKKLGYKVTIITYVRRPDLWSKSAHAQWGIKHTGKHKMAKSYKEWVKPRHIHYAEKVCAWQQGFPDGFIIKNYEEIKDVTKDFFDTLGIKNYLSTTSNTTLNKEYLALWAIYNSLTDEPNMPNDFMDVLNKLGLPKSKSLDLANLLPSQADIQQTYRDSKKDIFIINQILDKYNQSPFLEEPAKSKNSELNQLELIQYLAQMIFSLNERITQLEKTKKIF